MLGAARLDFGLEIDKHHPGAKIWVDGDTFMVNGTRAPYVRNSRHEARRGAPAAVGGDGT